MRLEIRLSRQEVRADHAFGADGTNVQPVPSLPRGYERYPLGFEKVQIKSCELFPPHGVLTRQQVDPEQCKYHSKELISGYGFMEKQTGKNHSNDGIYGGDHHDP